MTKDKLQLIINKYYLSGLIEQVKWVTKEGNLEIKFLSPSSDVVGIINSTIDFKDSVLGIADTSRLMKLISVLNQELSMDLVKQGSTFTKLLIEDNQFNLSYSLADLSSLRKEVTVDEPPTYEVTINLNQDEIGSLIKAKTALPDAKNIAFLIDEDIRGTKQVEVKIGDNNIYSDLITYVCKRVETTVTNTKVEYNADLFKAILYCNREVAEATINISTQGLMKIQFRGEDILSTYFLVQNEEI
jgi:hypothetical protein